MERLAIYCADIGSIERLPDPTTECVEVPTGPIHSLIGGALLWAGRSDDPALLRTGCLVWCDRTRKGLRPVDPKADGRPARVAGFYSPPASKMLLARQCEERVVRALSVLVDPGRRIR